VILDPTTYNCIYNSIGAQATWYKHAWGQRDYPDLSLNFSNFVKQFSNHETIMLKSTYGDALCWENIVDASKYFGPNLTAHTYGMCDQNRVNLYIDNGAKLKFDLDGVHDLSGKVFLGASWKIIKNNILISKNNAVINFHRFKHNQHQVEYLEEFCIRNNIRLEITDLNSTNIEPVVDQNSNWLYDVANYNHIEYQGLRKHLVTYNMLRTKISPPEKKNILSRPLVANAVSSRDLFEKFKKEFQHDGVFVSPSGHVFYNSEMFSMFMYMLGTDWDAGINTVKSDRHEYSHRVLFYAQKIILDCPGGVENNLYANNNSG
jgi:hypothetical protein